MTLKKITIDDIRSLRPCYDPARYLAEDWSGTALDILALTDVPPQDRLWIILHPEILDDTTPRRIACAFARETPIGGGRTVWDLLTDPRGRAAIETAERYCAGLATEEDLKVAWDDAWEAVWDDAEGAASQKASRAAVWAASGAASRKASRAAVWAAAWAVSRAASGDASWDAQIEIAARVVTRFCDAD
jgi:hypothetical protein